MTDCFVFARSVATRQSAVEKSRIQVRYPAYEKMAWHPTRGGFALPSPYIGGVAGSGRLGQTQAGGGGDAVLDPGDDLLQVRGVVDEVEELAVDRQDGAFGVFQRPLLVVAVQQAQVIGVDRVFNRTGTLLDPFNEGFNRRDQADEQRRLGQLPEDQLVQLEVGLVIPVGEVVQVVQGAHKDVGILVDAAVHDGRAVGIQQGFDLLGAIAQEIHLQMEGPGVHIRVEIGEIGVVIHRFVGCLPAKMLAEQLGEGGLTAANVPGQDNQTLIFF